MKIGVVKETYPGEQRVALVPAVLPSLIKGGMEVVIESKAGINLGIWTPRILKRVQRLPNPVNRCSIFQILSFRYAY